MRRICLTFALCISQRCLKSFKSLWCTIDDYPSWSAVLCWPVLVIAGVAEIRGSHSREGDGGLLFTHAGTQTLFEHTHASTRAHTRTHIDPSTGTYKCSTTFALTYTRIPAQAHTNAQVLSRAPTHAPQYKHIETLKHIRARTHTHTAKSRHVEALKHIRVHPHIHAQKINVRAQAHTNAQAHSRTHTRTCTCARSSTHVHQLKDTHT